jgi:hypothetical protein
MIYVQAHNEGTGDHYAVTLYAPHGGAAVPVLEKIKLLSESFQSFGCRGLKADEDALASCLLRQGKEFLVIGKVDVDLSHPFFFQF